MTDPTELLSEKELKFRECGWELRSDLHLYIMKDEADLEGEDVGEVQAITASMEGEGEQRDSFVIFYTHEQEPFSLRWRFGRFQTSDSHPRLHEYSYPANLPEIIGTFSFFLSLFLS